MSATDFVTEAQVDALAAAIAARANTQKGQIGDLATLTTTVKSSLVAAINEAYSHSVNADWNASSGDAQILNKPTLGTSAAKDVAATGNASATQVVLGNDTRLTDARTPVAHTHDDRYYTESEVDAKITAGTSALISDSATATTSTWSSSKISSRITEAIFALTSGAPAALDTLDELAAALGDDSNFAATLTTALGNRLRFDAAQVLTTAQKSQALANLGIIASTANFANTFTTAVS